MKRISLFLVFWAFANASEKIKSQLVNKNVERSIDLTSQLVKISTTITLENTGKDPIRSFLIAEEPRNLGNVSFRSVKDSSKNDLKFTPSDVDNHEDKKFYNVILKQSIEPGRSVSVVMEEVLMKSLEPYPNSITQKEKQLVRYFGNHYFYSPYFTTKQKTDVTLSSRGVENYTKLKPVSLSDSTISYGPYSSIQPFTDDEMVIHYESNAPFLTVTRLERFIEVSHWGNIAVEEHIEIRHTGAKLKGPFSRYDYQRDTSSVHHSIKAYRTILPASAHSIYYRDSNGNISTSSVRPRKEWIELELRPRFPLFGGWQSSYILGYSVPSYQYLFKSDKGDNILNMRIIDHVFDDMFVEELVTSVVLPVGVSDIRVKTPYEVERLPDEVTHKYLDNIGRTVIKLRKTNLVEQHIQDLEISYTWKPHLLLHEPVLLSIALFLLFVIVIVWVRLDFSLGVHDQSKRE
ncbi:dolichyl-diphosphooligosaccharide--protein glycosyltransferase subunit 1 [Leptinotarsa decemlineata]|uniref:dolichyl-diphosphooligosaccharide--protein glycosyltransferase subunit 1 n=1 Tax=Leptinotarsa decemlineata TaxID=7539 RepID=UPI000C252518|nr:dolichyl-diphosphooligosaccharide--protein glycosyltransferase subunit 1 [Leptinotarsa decemlineata]